MEKRLYRSQNDRIIWGVCGGLAEYFDIDPTIIRIIAILLALASGAGVLAYIILAIVIPLESSQLTEPKDVIKENVEDMKETASQLGQKIRSTFVSKEGTSAEAAKARHRRRNIFGIILIVMGIIFALANFNLLWWLRWDYLWPLILIGIGLLIILGVRRK